MKHLFKKKQTKNVFLSPPPLQPGWNEVIRRKFSVFSVQPLERLNLEERSKTVFISCNQIFFSLLLLFSTITLSLRGSWCWLLYPCRAVAPRQPSPSQSYRLKTPTTQQTAWLWFWNRPTMATSRGSTAAGHSAGLSWQSWRGSRSSTSTMARRGLRTRRCCRLMTATATGTSSCTSTLIKRYF